MDAPDLRRHGFDTAVLDIDGTLLDSNYHHAVAWARAFAAVLDAAPEPWPHVATSAIHRAIGMGGDRLVAHVAGAEVEERYGDAVRERHAEEYDRLLPSTGLLDGAEDLLAALGRGGLRVVLASSSQPQHAEHPLDLLRADEHADAWTTSEDAEASKPDPDLLEEALAKVGGGRAVMIGDAVWDVEAAGRAGLPSLALLSGGYGREELLAAGAVLVLDGPRELEQRLDAALAEAAAADRSR